jgi:penicillin-binding protein 1C
MIRLPRIPCSLRLPRLRYNLYTRNLPGKIAQIFTAFFLKYVIQYRKFLRHILTWLPAAGNIEGFPAAAWYYFDKDVKELSLSGIPSLVVIPQNPAKRAPLNGQTSTELIDSRKKLFKAWLEQRPEDTILETEMKMSPFLVNWFPLDYSNMEALALEQGLIHPEKMRRHSL